LRSKVKTLKFLNGVKIQMLKRKLQKIVNWLK